MKTLKLSLATLAVSAIAAGTLWADHLVKRIDHPNGPPTFVYAPDKDWGHATVGVFHDNRSFGTRMQMERGYRESDPHKMIHRGRGDTIRYHAEFDR